MKKTIKCQCLTCKKIFDIPKNCEDASCPDAGCDGILRTVESIKVEKERLDSANKNQNKKQTVIRQLIASRCQLLKDIFKVTNIEITLNTGPHRNITQITFRKENKDYSLDWANDNLSVALSEIEINEEGNKTPKWTRWYETFDEAICFLKEAK